MTRWTHTLTRAEWLRLSMFGGAVLLLHALGWGLFLYYSPSNPALAGLGVLAYTFGLRHAFDADHIAAIDNTTRKLLQEDQRPLGIGFFFSLGHSSIVFGLATGLALATQTVNSRIPSFQHYGSAIGGSVSGTFLWLIGILNLIVLIDIVRLFFDLRGGSYDEERLEQRLLERGFMNRFFLGRIARRITKSWQMYPLGVLFGLGFDTATEVGLLGISATQASQGLSTWSIMVFPALFTAGMTLIDTTDSVLMLGAYGWAFVKPIRKLYYNLTITALSVVVAVAVGGLEALNLIGGQLGLTDAGGFWGAIGSLNDSFGLLGYGIVGLFIVSWLISYVVYRANRYDEIEVEVGSA
jgi:nickel/cobalt transporter (NiCoT) family protein